MARSTPVRTPRQKRLEFASNQVGPQFPPAIQREVQALLAQLLVQVVRLESDTTQGEEDERQDP